MRTRPIGSIIGAIAGLVFVLANAGQVPASLVWRIGAAAAFAVIIWFVVLRGPEVQQALPSRSALRTYGVAVSVMIVAIPLGAAFISNVLDRPDTVLVWVVFVVGAHFLPFARAFTMPVFRWLATSMIVISVVGAIPALASDSATAAASTGVAAGSVLLFFSAAGPQWNRDTAE
ncbi:hypothetical protein C6I20_06540 [Aeromicrobium sp. A1-2]|uniref:hypothetical protein n=1 Tax=Aeromicrobium sp. A1-2 TaxID=2107713 RepID=UPI000E523DAF|nr:hypothetical protein [Aeromicrobium sp. A1-2]AXT84884.1 hypothetical protein C6I20_06540 [Aeromicrobium sp. A1-2]